MADRHFYRYRGRKVDAVGDCLLTTYAIIVSLGRALLFTGLGIFFFLVGFLGYFTISFVFLGAALLLLASGTASRHYRRFRERSSLR